jgi:hypothetical protein
MMKRKVPPTTPSEIYHGDEPIIIFVSWFVDALMHASGAPSWLPWRDLAG